MDYLSLKRAALSRFFQTLNDCQKEAVFTVNGAVLIVAGAGSGKTTVLINRITNLLLFGDAYYSEESRQLSEDDLRFLQGAADAGIDKNDPVAVARLSGIIAVEPVKPWRILAVTFTNKAAAELRSRIEKSGAVSESSGIAVSDIWAQTFHSCCVKMLRRGIDLIGYPKNFTIFDDDDTNRLIKQVMKELQIPDTTIDPKMLQRIISRAKDMLQSPDNFVVDTNNIYVGEAAKRVYTEYQRRLKAAGGLDFDDIIMKTVEMLQADPETLKYWQNKFRYIMVDEYQDTNYAQYKLVAMLAGSGNLCVVGDEDQSIYKFRGASIENILSFEKQFGAKSIKLEQNYRSTTNILSSANAVISQNTQRKPKELWSDLGEGEKVNLVTLSDDAAESRFVAEYCNEHVAAGGKYSDIAVLFRMNAMSRGAENALVRSGIPYRIVGGTRFYSRKEVKDALAYIHVVNNPNDLVHLRRIINEPKRKIGDTTVGELERITTGLGISPLEIMADAASYPTLSRASGQLSQLARIFTELRAIVEEGPLEAVVDGVLNKTGYREMLMKPEKAGTPGLSGEDRLKNIEELKTAMQQFAEESPETDNLLGEYLEQAALISDLDSYDTGDDRVVLMTMHAAKGLEFDTVFVIGVEEDVFPAARSAADPEEIEEERRLAYVAYTRAKRMLFITSAKQRQLYGQTKRNRVSRFATGIPDIYTVQIDKTVQKPLQQQRSPNKRAAPAHLPVFELSSSGITPSASAGTTDGFSVGDKVGHKTFGEGMVLSSKAMGGDTLLEIAFDNSGVGTKKVMANFAKLKKL